MSSSSSSSGILSNAKISQEREAFLASMLSSKRRMEAAATASSGGGGNKLSSSGSGTGAGSRSRQKKRVYAFHDIFDLKDLAKFRQTKSAVVASVYQHTADKETSWKEVNIHLLQYLPAVAVLGSNFLVIKAVKWEDETAMQERYQRFSPNTDIAEMKKRLYVQLEGVAEMYSKIGGITEEEEDSLQHWFTVPTFWVDDLAPLVDKHIDPFVGAENNAALTAYVIYIYDTTISESATPDSYGKLTRFVYGKALLCKDSLRTLIPSVRNEALSYFDKPFLTEVFSTVASSSSSASSHGGGGNSNNNKRKSNNNSSHLSAFKAPAPKKRALAPPPSPVSEHVHHGGDDNDHYEEEE
jgi:hypothetical protein